MPLALDTIPRATYRVQLHSEFRFADVTALVPYLAALGISHVYCSPYLRARPGSRHGYDIVDHRMLNPEIGTREEFDHMVDTLARHGMSHLCDVVPNHMAIMGADNARWMDVLENGPSSSWSEFFDLDWAPQDADLAGKVLVAILGEPYGTVLERGELRLEFEPAAGSFAIRYFEHRFPVDPREFPRVLGPALEEARDALDTDVAAEVEQLVSRLQALPARDDPVHERVVERRRSSGELKQFLAMLAAGNRPLARAIDGAVMRINGKPGDPASFEALHELIEAQAFRLAYWRVASDEINYRRFFDVNDLAGLRTENEAVFDATHDFILDLAAEGVIGGLRIDHPDGLYDPARYFSRLQERFRDRVAQRGSTESDPGAGAYVVIEKIAAPHERLPESWPIHGTTGYRFANLVNGLFVDTRARGRVDRVWRAFVGNEANTFEGDAYRGRRAMMEGALAADLAAVTLRALRIARADRRTRDFTFNALKEAIEEIVARFPVYRTYVDAHGSSAQDRRYVDWAVARTRAHSRRTDTRILDFLHDALLGAPPEGAAAKVADDYRAFAMRFQQFTAPVAAKGVEDTAFYTFNRLVSLNEVGGDPDQFGASVRSFHLAGANRAALWPHTMVATSTHDNKRSEDVRARIDVISEMPAVWRLTVRRWMRINRSRSRIVDGYPSPSRSDEYLLYQSLVGTFPPGEQNAAALEAYRERMERYAIKAAREAKVRTSWFAVNEPYEAALTDFVAALLRTTADNLFLAELRAQSAMFAWFGLLNSVSMTLLKLASPGVPDIYQGTELLDWSLVDPDNRRPVDYALRRRHLDSLGAHASAGTGSSAAFARSLFTAPYDGRAKLWVILRALELRRACATLFAHGDYRRVAVVGERADHVVAFARMHGEEGVLVAAGRLFASLGLAPEVLPVGDAWKDTELDLGFLPPGTVLDNVLTNETFVAERDAARLARLFADFPGALLRFSTQSRT